jgi:GntR family transcriptional regulator, negative regulator for fad regulon and positive regulator of fabA
LDDSPELYASFDWELHKTLTICSNNPIYSMILNGFSGFYEQMGLIYFQQEEARLSSQSFYRRSKSCPEKDHEEAEKITRKVMQDSITLWEKPVTKA